jgi:phosphoglycolate phosphatase-like HAD superfamily hydrolase
MNFDCVILDFDGTFTEVEKEAVPFVAAYRAAINDLVGPEHRERWDVIADQVHQDPGQYGWRFDGRIVAPANSDPYLRATVCTNLLFDELGLYGDLHERQELLESLYRGNYTKADSCFRPEAKEVIEKLIASGLPVWVVTNSDTEAVEAKIRDLGPVGREKLIVRGNAKKYIVTELDIEDERFAQVPVEQRIPTLERPLYLRRGHYFRLLEEIWEKTQASPERTIVAGDIYELDLCLPAALGVAVHLLERDTTPPHEVEATRSAGGATSRDLYAVLERVGLS